MAASKDDLAGILAYTEGAVFSTDFAHVSYTKRVCSILDASAGIVRNETFVKLVAWYDSERGCSTPIMRSLSFHFPFSLFQDSASVRGGICFVDGVEDRSACSSRVATAGSPG